MPTASALMTCPDIIRSFLEAGSDIRLWPTEARQAGLQREVSSRDGRLILFDSRLLTKLLRGEALS